MTSFHTEKCCRLVIAHIESAQHLCSSARHLYICTCFFWDFYYNACLDTDDGKLWHCALCCQLHLHSTYNFCVLLTLLVAMILLGCQSRTAGGGACASCPRGCITWSQCSWCGLREAWHPHCWFWWWGCCASLHQDSSYVWTKGPSTNCHAYNIDVSK